MAETVRSLRVQVKITGVVVGDDDASKSVDFTYDKTFSNGTGADQLGSVWEDKTRALNTTSEDLDLGTGGLTDFQGAALVLNNVKLFCVQNLDTDTGDNFRLKEGSANPVTSILNGTNPEVEIGPDGLLLLVNPVDGYAVTDSTADTIGIQAVDNSTYRVLVAGDNA